MDKLKEYITAQRRELDAATGSLPPGHRERFAAVAVQASQRRRRRSYAPIAAASLVAFVTAAVLFTIFPLRNSGATYEFDDCYTAVGADEIDGATEYYVTEVRYLAACIEAQARENSDNADFSAIAADSREVVADFFRFRSEELPKLPHNELAMTSLNAQYTGTIDALKMMYNTMKQ